MKVSVIVPVYNTYDYLNKCLDSLVNQSFKDYEIIIVNDGSTDDSEKIIKEYQKKYSNIKYYYKENGGLSSARNYGIKYANGEYIAFVDSDDYVDKEFLKKMYDKITIDNSDILVCEFSYDYGDGNIIRSYSNLEYTSDSHKKYLLTPPKAVIRMYKKELFKKLKFKEGIFYEDLEMNPKMVLYAKKISYLNESLYYYVIRSGSIMKQKKFNKKLLDIFDVLDSNKKILEKDYFDEIEYMYITHLLRTASLRFLDYDNYREMIDKINHIMKDEYSNWKKNIYYQKSSKKIKLICFLVSNKCFILLKLLKKVSGK